MTDSIASLAKLVIHSFVQLYTPTQKLTESTDGVHAYVKEVLTLGLIWYGFYDAIKKGDGNRVLRYWKFLLVIFKATTHRNYAKECVTMLYHYNYVLSDRQKEQFLWNRFINTKGGTGNNISCDLNMEHLNRRLKSILRGMGSNISPQRINQSIEVVQRVCDAFEKQTAARIHSDNHPYPAFGKDFDTVLTVLINSKSFVEIENRKYQTFQFTKSILRMYTAQSHSYSRNQENANQSGPTLAYRQCVL